MPKIYLHIGTPKTGSTTVQRFLRANRATLLSRGWLCPQTPGIPAVSLVAYAQEDGASDASRKRLKLKTPGQIRSFRNRLRDELAREVDEAGAQSIILSCETLSERLSKPAELERLRDLLSGFSTEIEVLAYLRRQDESAISRYHTYVRNGGTTPFALPYSAKVTDRRFDYLGVLNLWSGVFGKENIRVRRFGRGYFSGGDLLADFGEAIGLPMQGLEEVDPYNESLEIERMEFMRLMNLSLGENAHTPYASYLRNLLIAEADKAGPRLGVSAADRRNFAGIWDASNHQVAREFLQLDGDLFDHPFADNAPASETLLGGEAAVTLATHLLKRSRHWDRAKKRYLARVAAAAAKGEPEDEAEVEADNEGEADL